MNSLNIKQTVNVIIAAFDMSLDEYAEKLHLNKRTLYRKMDNNSFTSEELLIIDEDLDIVKFLVKNTLLPE